MKKSYQVLCAATLFLGIAGSANAATVGVWGDRYGLSTINTFYDGLTGHDSSILGDLTNLTDVDLLWAVQPADAYSSTELGYMNDFLGDGGRIAFMGEHEGFAPAENDRINDALSYLNSGMSIINQTFDGGFHDATKTNGQILDHTLTEGVNTYNYAAFAGLSIDITGNAETLMLGLDLTSIMMAYENVLNGSLFLITDQNVWDNVYSISNDNAVMFENLLTGETGGGTDPVPEPGTMLLFSTGLVGLIGLRNRKKRK